MRQRNETISRGDTKRVRRLRREEEAFIVKSASRRLKESPDGVAAFDKVVADLKTENVLRLSQGLRALDEPSWDTFKATLKRTLPAAASMLP